MRRMRRTDGFTLVELMIVVTIIGIMAFVAVPGFKSWMHHARFTGFARDAFTEFQQGRNRTLGTGVPHEVVVDPSNETIRIRRTSDGAFVRDLLVAPPSCDIVSGTNVTFLSNGTASSNGNVRIKNRYKSDDDQTITVTLGTGRVKLQ